ncbi:MAG: hypothetical protein OJF47_000854 [Nitrospira sp.]|nr:MAG: hypothetical protein OJF47_000854 [Nitrospira sp.]
MLEVFSAGQAGEAGVARNPVGKTDQLQNRDYSPARVWFFVE